jgi:hypothetical protein
LPANLHASGSLRMPGESTLAPRSSNATEFSRRASQEVYSAWAMVFRLGDAKMLHTSENKHQFPNGVARSEVGVTSESPSLAVVSGRQRQRETDTIMEALIRQYLART